MTALTETKNVLKVGLPKGSLQDATVALFAKAGFHISISSRGYFPAIDDDDIECMLIRPQEASRYVEQGLLDLAVTGFDWILGRDVIEVAELEYSKQLRRPVRWVVAVPMDSPIRTVADLNGKRIATEAVELTQNFLREQGIDAEVEFSWGATEVKPPYLADAIVDRILERGRLLRLDGPSIRTKHLPADELRADDQPQAGGRGVPLQPGGWRLCRTHRAQCARRHRQG